MIELVEINEPEVTVDSLIPRHKGNGNPKIFPESEAGKSNPKGAFYTRVTTYIDCLGDKSTLAKWQQRGVIEGLSRDPRIVEDYRALGPAPDAHKVNALVERARMTANQDLKASIGDALHKATEAIDRGERPMLVPPDHEGDIEAYRRATEGFEWLRVEAFGVRDDIKVAGTMDRLVKLPEDLHEELELPLGTVVSADLKGFALDTPIPTPEGWTTMRSVQVGERVLGADGYPCTVTDKSEVKMLDCYRVTFDDTSSVVCDAEHLWETTAGSHGGATEVRSITEIRDTLLDARGAGRHKVRNAEPLALPERDLPIDPYALGVWLGDGKAMGGDFTKGRGDGQIADEIRSRGYEVSQWSDSPARGNVSTWNVLGLRAALAHEGLLGNKQVPDAYLRGSERQRLDLLRGLMDTDGTYNTARSSVSFSSCDKALASAVYELVVSLGERAHMGAVERTGFGLTVTAYDVKWTPRLHNPFLLHRKADQVTLRDTGKNGRRLIRSVEKVPTVPTACIAVDSSDRMYLVGESMIPTHNTGSIDLDQGKIAMQLAIYASMDNYDPITYKRTPMTVNNMPISREVGIIIHLPQGTGECHIVPVDLRKAQEGLRLALEVRSWRAWWGAARNRRKSVRSVLV